MPQPYQIANLLWLMRCENNCILTHPAETEQHSYLIGLLALCFSVGLVGAYYQPIHMS